MIIARRGSYLEIPAELWRNLHNKNQGREEGLSTSGGSRWLVSLVCDRLDEPRGLVPSPHTPQSGAGAAGSLVSHCLSQWPFRVLCLTRAIRWESGPVTTCQNGQKAELRWDWRNWHDWVPAGCHHQPLCSLSWGGWSASAHFLFCGGVIAIRCLVPGDAGDARWR